MEFSLDHEAAESSLVAKCMFDILIVLLQIENKGPVYPLETVKLSLFLLFPRA